MTVSGRKINRVQCNKYDCVHLFCLRSADKRYLHHIIMTLGRAHSLVWRSVWLITRWSSVQIRLGPFSSLLLPLFSLVPADCRGSRNCHSWWKGRGCKPAVVVHNTPIAPTVGCFQSHGTSQSVLVLFRGYLCRPILAV